MSRTLYDKSFMITGEPYGPEDLPYRKPNTFSLFQKPPVIDAKGDVTQLQMYQGYDPGTDTYTNLVVQEDRVYTRDASGLLTQRDTTTTWYFTDETPGTTKDHVKYYDALKGYEGNKRSRNNLINNASMYLFASLTANDPVNGDQQAKDFLVLASQDENVGVYIGGNIAPLVDFITNTTEAYITPTIRATLITILNVTYP